MLPDYVAFDPQRILEVLARHQVQCVVIGGYAVVLAGVDIVTRDIDITPATDPANLQRLAAALGELNAALRAARVSRPFPYRPTPVCWPVVRSGISRPTPATWISPPDRTAPTDTRIYSTAPTASRSPAAGRSRSHPSRTIVSAAQAIQTGDDDVALAGGAESMSRGAYWLQNGRWGAGMGDASLVDAVVGALTDPFNKIHMGVTAENRAESHGISREAQDEFALESQRRAQAAVDAGRFDDEIVPVEIKTHKETVEFKVDEHIRRDASLERFGKLKPAFDKNGTVTAGNASGVNDAGAAGIVMSADGAEKSDAPIRARILSYAVCGVEPKTMGIGPVPAVRKALERAGKNLDDVDVIELNEAFAAQSLAAQGSPTR